MHIAPEVEDKHIREAIASLQQIRGDKSAPMGECDVRACRAAMCTAYCDGCGTGCVVVGADAGV
jgi:hypothetical protein